MKFDIAFIYCCVQSIRAKTMPHNATALQFKALSFIPDYFDSVPFMKNVHDSQWNKLNNWLPFLNSFNQNACDIFIHSNWRLT